MQPRTAFAVALVSSLIASPLAAQEPGARSTDTVPGTDLVFEMIFLAGGEFTMGSPAGEPGRDDDEGPVRRVRVDGFWLGVHEVAHEAYQAFRNPQEPLPEGIDAVTHPSTPYEDPTHGMGADGRPAVGMTRQGALHYARWLSLHTGHLYRLPTEAEWEYACRSGRLEAGAKERGWYDANSGGRLQEVGSRTPDRNGVHDLLGNAAEWTLDPYVADFYAGLPEDRVTPDPRSGPAGAGRGVVRGGSFLDGADEARCAARQPEATAWKRRDPQIPRSRWWNTDAPHVGFRLLRDASPYTAVEIQAWWDRLLGTSRGA